MFCPHQITHNGHEYVAISYCTVLHLIICCNLVLHLFFCPNPQLRSFTLLIVLGVSFDTQTKRWVRSIALFPVSHCTWNVHNLWLWNKCIWPIFMSTICFVFSVVFSGLLALAFFVFLCCWGKYLWLSLVSFKIQKLVYNITQAFIVGKI